MRTEFIPDPFVKFIKRVPCFTNKVYVCFYPHRVVTLVTVANAIALRLRFNTYISTEFHSDPVSMCVLVSSIRAFNKHLF